jgi:hypothetical protein
MNEPHPCRVRLGLFVAVVCCSILAKRARDVQVYDDEEPEPQKRRRNCEERGVLRQGVAIRLLRLDDFVFKKMFRMTKAAFLLLHDKIAHSITTKHPYMGTRSSGSSVESLLIFAATIRWLAGGSPWDICFGFHLAYSTLHARKYAVITAINNALSGM